MVLEASAARRYVSGAVFSAGNHQWHSGSLHKVCRADYVLFAAVLAYKKKEIAVQKGRRKMTEVRRSFFVLLSVCNM